MFSLVDGRKKLKLYVLDGGALGPYEKSLFTFDVDVGKKIILSVWQAYIDHPEAKIIIDTGINPKTDELSQFGRKLHQDPSQRIEEQLARIGVNPNEIDIVINTHLHYDHTAYNKLFKKATFIVQKEEMRHAYVPESFEESFYQPREHFDVPYLNYELIEGDYPLLKGIDILFTPGHTAGHQSVLIETEKSGPIIIAGDAAYLKENMDKLIIPAIHYDPSLYLSSLKRIKRIAQQKGAQVFFSHDLWFFNSLKKSPVYYE
jgi:glyoxylase-like metal-dependent hydrolase (beta-lactamase superfamily II)